MADVDNDGEAEILVHGYQNDNEKNLRVYCFESATTPWAPARSVWNQYGYHVTNVNDDLTIPRQQQNQAAHLEGHENCLRPTCPAPYNAFLAQATYRTQEGCVQFPAADLSVAIIGMECMPDSVSICMEVGSRGSRPVTGPVGIVGYTANPTGGAAMPIATAQASFNDSLKTDTLCLTVPSAFLLDSLFVTISDEVQVAAPFAFPVTALTECDYTNNIAAVAIPQPLPPISLGPDVTKCESEVITLNAGAGYENYLWSDGTVDSIYSSSFEGLHFVTATDACGRAYSDTMAIIIAPINEVELGADRDVCPQEEVQVSITGDYDFIQWLPADHVDCADCMGVTVFPPPQGQGDTSFSLMVVVGKGSCYSSDTLSFFIKQKTEVMDSQSLCEGDTLHLMGEVLTAEGQYEFNLNGCDSFLLLNLQILPKDTTPIEQQICMGDSLFFSGSYLKDPGLYTATATNAAGCDSLLFLNLQILPKDTTPIAQQICMGDSLSFDGGYLKDPGFYTSTATNTFGCDSLVFLDLTVVESIAQADTLSICEGDSVQVFGQWLTKDTLVSGAFTSIAGCDSTQSFLVKTIPLPYLPVHYDLCVGDSVQVGNEWLTAEGFYEIKIAAQVGCDSIFGVTVGEVPPIAKLDTLVICENDSVEVFGQWVSGETLLSETFQSAVGCDSIQSFQVLQTPLPHQPVHFDICMGDSLLFGNGWFTEAGFYEMTLPAQVGCDTVFEISIGEIPPISNLDTLQICEGDSVKVFGQWVEGGAFLTETFTGITGCDSTQSFQIIETALVQQTASFQLCSGDSVQVGSEWLSTFGSHSLIAPSVAGCDTLYEVELSEALPIILPLAFALCEGDSVQVAGEWLFGEGQYQVLVDPTVGCDTLFEVAINGLLPTENMDSLDLCEGDSLLLFGQYVSSEGMYSGDFTGSNGCDSTQVFFIEIKNMYSTSEEVALCPGDSVFLSNQWVYGPGEVIATATAANGCDSIHTYHITSLPQPLAPTSEVDCANLMIVAEINAPAPWQVAWSNGDTSQQTVFENAGTAAVSLSAEPDCEMDFTLLLSPLPDPSLLPVQANQLLQAGQPFSINLNLDDSEWRVQWSPSAIFTCDTCLQTEVLPIEDSIIEAVFIHSSGCVYVSSFQITIQPKSGLYIPNAFSPNDDGTNDVWTVYPSDENILLEEVLIFGRWGNMVASWHGVHSFSWDGTSKGRLLDAGIFAYYIRYVDGQGKVVERKGDVVLAR